MKHLRIILSIILSIILLTSRLFGQETGVLYQYKGTSGLIWKTFGKGSIQPKYEGEVLNRSPNGFGVLSYPFTDGKSVVGEWKDGNEWNTEHYNNDGKLIGKLATGKLILMYGILCGTLKDSKILWAEKCYEGPKNKYLGDIEDMKPNGQGTLTTSDGEKYVGGFKNGKKSGQGALTTSDGEKHVGVFKNGKKNGQGTLTTSDGKKYVGVFKNGKKNGQGTLTTLDGEKYVGAFTNGEKSGQGTLTTSDGEKYVGAFMNGEKNGKGILTSQGGFKYVGIFKNGKKNGTGTFTWPDGGKYKGEWKDGKFHGQGSFTFSDKNIGVGEFRKNKPWNISTYDKDGKIIWQMKHGIRVENENILKIEQGILFRDTPLAKWLQSGKMWFSSGDVGTQAKYEGDILTGFPEGHGTLTFPSGSEYVGYFKDSKFHGQGTMTYSDGRKYVGDYKDGKPWNVKTYGKNGKISYKFVNGKRQ